MTQTIKVSNELWDYLNSHRSRDCRSFEDVIWRFIRDDNQQIKGGQENETNNKELV